MRKIDKMQSIMDLKKDGWTAGLIAKFLREADETRGAGPIVKYYRSRRVAEVKSTQAFQQAATAVAIRAQAKKEAKQKKLAFFEGREFLVPTAAKRMLIQEARSDLKDQCYYGTRSTADLDATDQVIVRDYLYEYLMRNFVRDAMSAGIPLNAKDHKIMSFHVHRAISSVHPWLETQAVG